MSKKLGSGAFVFLFSFCLLLPRTQADSPPVGSSYPDLEPEISMDFKDAEMKDIMKVLSVQSGLNFIASGAVRDRKVTLYLDKVPLEQAMNKIFQANNLAYELDRDANIFIVKDLGEENEHDLITRVFYLKHATVSSSSIKEEMSAELSSSAGAASASGVGGTASSGGKSSEEKGKWVIDKDTGITQAVRKMLTKDRDGKEVGIVIEDYRTNSLIVTDVPSKMPVIAALIASLDRAVPQIMLEVEILDVSKALVDKIGVNFANAGSFSMQVISAARRTTFPLSGFDPETGIGDIAKGLASSGHPTDQKFTPGEVSFPTNLNVVLDFLNTQTDTKYLARPRILTLNNEPAEIKIATSQVVGEMVTVDQTTGRPVSSTPERQETGVFLRVTPQIDPDKNEILMFVLPKVVEAGPSSFVSAINGQQFLDPETRGTKSLVRIKDGETIIIGGLIRNQKTQTNTKLPYLGDIPLLGSLFRHKNKSRDIERELLIFITPRIVRDGADADIAKMPAPAMGPAREQVSLPRGSTRQVAINSSLNRFDGTNK